EGGQVSGREGRAGMLSYEKPDIAGGSTQHIVTGLGEKAQQLAGLVGGDAAADAQDDVHSQDQEAPSMGSAVSRPSATSRSAMDSGFSCACVSTSGPTYSSRPSPSCE